MTQDLSETLRMKRHERQALLFASAVRALGAFGFSNLNFDIGGKKARRRYVSGLSPNGTKFVIWIKSAERWDATDVVRFPWKKLADEHDGQRAVLVACESAEHRGVTHLLAVAGDLGTGALSVARLYPLAEVAKLVGAQAKICTNWRYRAHGASLILQSSDSKFLEAAKLAGATGEDILDPPVRETMEETVASEHRRQTRRTYVRDPKIRARVLTIAEGRCECCGELGFVTESGRRYLETHHVVGVSQRGPDSVDNIIAVCPICHRKAHFAAERIQVEVKMLEAIRRRGRKSDQG